MAFAGLQNIAIPTNYSTTMMPSGAAQLVTPEKQRILPAFDVRQPGGEYDTPHRAGLHSIWAWEEYNGRKPNNQAIFDFLDIDRKSGYNLLKSSTVRTVNNRPEPNPRGRKHKLTDEKAHEIKELLEH